MGNTKGAKCLTTMSHQMTNGILHECPDWGNINIEMDCGI